MEWSQYAEGTVQSVVNKCSFMQVTLLQKTLKPHCGTFLTVNGIKYKHLFHYAWFYWQKVSLVSSTAGMLVYSWVRALLTRKLPQCSFTNEKMDLLGHTGTVISKRGNKKKKSARGLASEQHCDFAGLCRSQLPLSRTIKEDKKYSGLEGQKDQTPTTNTKIY